MHIGTNDIIQGQQSGASDRLTTLVDQIVEASPDALLAVAQIIPYPGAASAVSSFNAAIPAIVNERAAAGAHVILVDQFTDFPDSELDDGVHPNPDGYARMANVWYTAIESYLP